MSTDDAVTGVNPTECVHVVCSGWETCRFLPEPFGPELPDLILDSNGSWWGDRVPGGRVWWYGSNRMVTWSALCRMRDGLPPLMASDQREDAFPWGPWVGSDYARSAAAEAAMAELVAAAVPGSFVIHAGHRRLERVQ